MNSQSALQQQFPLSSRKFWKKIITSVVGYGIISLLIGGFLGGVVALAVSGGNTDSIIALVLSSVVGFLLVFSLLIGIYAWYVKTYIKVYYYSGEEHFITIKKGVFAPAEIHVQWQKIQDVYVDQDILDRIMGLYDVHIASATATSGIEAHIDGVDEASAQGLKEFLLNKVSGKGTSPVSNQTEISPSQPKATPIDLTEEISNRTYPLSSTWVSVTLFTRVVGSFGFTGIFILFIFSESLGDITNLDKWLYLVLGWFALGVLTVIVRTITFFLWKKNYAFDFTPENIYYREGVISLSEKHMPYSSIQDVTVRQGVVERFFGLAKVVIENAAQQQMISTRYGKQPVGFAGVILQGISIEDANKITNLLKTTVLGRNSTQYGL